MPKQQRRLSDLGIVQEGWLAEALGLTGLQLAVAHLQQRYCELRVNDHEDVKLVKTSIL